ncbi:MAG: ABC transporter ATP-binding protein [Gemmatimonadales bacterium]|nr:ABC transporter ATP-binding protein [Gemmatimonadales bacterium]
MSVPAPTSAAAPAAPRAPQGEVAIRLEGLTKRFPVRRTWTELLRRPTRRASQIALEDVTCSVGRGEFFGLLGANGAGKTTLFKVLATLVLPDSGTATVDGHDVVRQAAAVRRVLAPVITDERSLHWRLSARENLLLYARLQGLRGGLINRRVDEVLHTVGLEPAHRALAGGLSSGMKQRLLIARALLAEPRVLLLDEPTRSLDPLAARSFRAFLRDELSGRQGCTVILATHNTEEALELCGRVAILDRGRLLAVGTAEELSREVMGERYRVWTRGPWQGVVAKLVEAGLVREYVLLPLDAGEWAQLDLRIDGALDGAADTLRAFADANVDVARFERLGATLADVIGRVVARRQGTSDD